MVIRNSQKGYKAVSYKLAFGAFLLMLVWPLAHLVIIHVTSVSSWRLWGWGMYATPDPRSYASLRVVIRNPLSRAQFNTQKLYERVASISGNPAQESLCINLYQEDSNNTLSRLETAGLCQGAEAFDALNYFLHFGSLGHLGRFVSHALDTASNSGLETNVFLTKQRIDIFHRQAYLENIAYITKQHHTAFVGTFIDRGNAHEGQYF